MSRDPRLFLDDIISAIDTIREYTRGYALSTFCDDKKTQDAVIKNLAVIGEAARSLPEEIRAMAPDVGWRKVVDMRNILVHQYFGLNLQIIWDVA